MKKIVLLFFSLLLISSITFADTLVGAVLITRHGDRAPFGNIQTMNYQWGSPLQELTPIGMSQAYQLGSQLRNELIINGKLLSSSYQANTIQAFSSTTNRTFNTAECVLMGLYPPGTGPHLTSNQFALPNGFQPIPITILTNNNMILTPYPEYLALLQKYVYSSPAWLSLQQQYALQFPLWHQALGNPVNNLADVLSVGDTLIVAQAHHLPMPPGLTANDVSTITHLTEQALALQFQNLSLSDAMGGQLLNTIITNLQDMSTQKAGETKLFYYSGHDITILPIMSLLGQPLTQAPGYASNLLFKLYETSSNTYYVVIEYNGQALSLPIMHQTQQVSLSSLASYVSAINAQYSSSGSATLSN